MYTLQKIFDDLAYGELSQVNLSGKNSDCECGEFDKKAEKTIISHLNMALVDLYTRFPLREREVTIQLYPEIVTYILDSKYAVSNEESDEPVKYIEDSKFLPFTDDVIRIERCYDEGGVYLHINDEMREYSVFTPTYNSIQVPYPEEGYAMFVIYRAKHSIIPFTYDDASKVNIDLPPYLYEALLYYIAYRVHKARSNQEAQLESSRLYQMYEKVCGDVERRNLTNNGITSSNARLDINGWV